ncbi:MAG: hypothetical protein DRO67_00705 [Candidatus Asgardarchaeum californiense]|nr:MAG: hypothetical protein DRO67_00705 [Candidatus Asgardarchaeum californiense]
MLEITEHIYNHYKSKEIISLGEQKDRVVMGFSRHITPHTTNSYIYFVAVGMSNVIVTDQAGFTTNISEFYFVDVI